MTAKEEVGCIRTVPGRLVNELYIEIIAVAAL